MKKNKITTITRRNIADEMQINKICYNGRLSEPDFLSRIFNLKELPSTDYRYNNAYDDIYKHVVMNTDWGTYWVFTDVRFNLMHCDDDTYLMFLTETIHPAIRNDEQEILKIQEIYNRNLEPDGYEIIQTSEISGKPIFSGQEIIIGKGHLIAKKAEIKKYLNTEYVNNKINLMNENVRTDTDLAIGTAKELIEIVCKSILKHNGKFSDPDWNLGRLLKETTNTLDFKPKFAENPNQAETSIKQILGGISSIIQGISELRNSYGSGHGKDADFKGLEPKFAKLIVGIVAELVIFYLASSGENYELID
jgi:hypothetical protein